MAMDPVWALGLMSGTSMDGIDAAMVLTDGVAIHRFGPTASHPWEEAERTAFRAAMAAGEVHGRAVADRDPDAIGAALRVSDTGHAAVAARFLGGSPAPDLVGLHGQTVLHLPAEGHTLQLGDGAALAGRLGLPVVWDFRSDDLAAGGEGAPLAPFFHWALARRAGLGPGPVAFLNIGGVANVTWIDPAGEAPEAPGTLIGFDTGPGNALVDDWVQARTGAPCDAGGALAARGRVHGERLRSNAVAAYLGRPAPKSLDRQAFQAVRAGLADLSTEDGAATLTALTADCVAAARAQMPLAPTRWLVCGGGRHNATMMAMLAERLAVPVDPVEALGLDGDMLEAQAFAWLAVRVWRGLPTSAPGTTGCRAPVCGGRIARP